MAEESSSSDGEGKNPLGQVIFLLIVLFAITGSLITKDFFSTSDNYTDRESGLISPSKILSSGNVELGKKVINREIVDVRQSVAGSVIGKQFKRAVGIIKEGPYEEYGAKWWRVDYEDTPDGWVTEDKLTTKIGWFRVLNIIPILYDFIKPIFLALSLILIIILLVVKVLHNKVSEVESKKQELAKGKLLQERQEGDKELDTIATFPANLPTDDSVPVFFENKKGKPKNERWEHVQSLVHSRNESDWRQAIMEADIILDSMLERMGYDGDSVGEKLKKIEESDFLTLNKAWDAHRVRNKIAHSGINFYLDKNEAERVVKLYKEVFEEFYYI
ncbi:hypothetical protein H6775_01640 [Candidatus Nomurabacteria bacterium]|nr:hypothetical protein [Candidatus Nomurabacteria bacterium]